MATADKYIGGTLVALQPVTVYNNTTSNARVVRQVKKGGLVGVIYSWKRTPTNENPDNFWWMLEDGNFVHHETGLFDFGILEKSIVVLNEQRQAEIDKRVDERKKNNDNPFYNFFGDLEDIFKYAVILLILLYVVIPIINKTNE